MTATVSAQDPPRSGSATAVRALWRRWVLVAADAPHKQWWRNFATPRGAEVWAAGRHHRVTGRVVGAGPERAAAVATHAARRRGAELGMRDVARGEIAVVVLHHVHASAGAPTASATGRDWP